jgi:hypothetical protein
MILTCTGAEGSMPVDNGLSNMVGCSIGWRKLRLGINDGLGWNNIE